MIRPTTSRTITCQQHDGIVTRKHDLLSRLTPPLRSVVFLHHQRDHVQLLLVGVVGLQTTLRKQATDTWHRPAHEWDPSQRLQTFAPSTVQQPTLALTFADSLYFRLTAYSITSAPSIASLIASIVDPFMFVKSNHVA